MRAKWPGAPRIRGETTQTVCHNKSLKHEKGVEFKFKRVSIFCLIQGINNYAQINIYWSYIEQIGIFINLASKQCFLTSQGVSKLELVLIVEPCIRY